MSLFFDAGKYITRVESPRISRNLPRKQQVLLYIEKYFDMYNHEYLGDVYNACVQYIDDTLEDQDDSAKSVTSAEIQAVSTIIKGLKDFIDNKRHEEFKYMRILAATEAYKLFCGMISKMLELEIIDIKQAKRRIGKFYKQCGID